MAIYLDSALPDDARQAFALGFVRGITTNPVLLRKTARSPAEVLSELCQICSGTVFYQLTAASVALRLEEGERVLQQHEEWCQHMRGASHDIQAEKSGASVPCRLGLKIPASPENMALVAEFAARDLPVAVTALFNLSQAYAACEAGATFLLPYVNRYTRLRGDGILFVRQLAEVCKATDRGTKVLAASIKSPDEAVQALLAGACHVSMPLSVLLSLARDPLSEQARAEFDAAAT